MKKELCMVRIFLSLMIITLFSISSYADDAVVAKVNSTVFTQKDLDDEVDRLIPRITFHRSVSQEKRKFYYDKALEELINRELQYQDAIAMGMQPDKEKVKAQMEKIRKRFKSEDEYKVALEKEGTTEEKLRAKVEKEVLVQNVIAKKVTEASQISENELKQYYEKNPSKFKKPESIKIKIISVKDEKKGQDVLAKIKAGEDFGALAYNMSEDSYRVKSGDVGYIHKGRMLSEIDNVAFKMKVGEVSDLIKAGDSWFIVKVEDKKPEQQLSFEEIKDKLKKEKETEKARSLKEAWITDLRSKAKIEVLLKTGSEGNKK
jgi:parvulin-like peptidyl-prolyl isomerase